MSRGGNAADDSGVITYKDVEEMRTLRNPPEVVRRTLEVTCLIVATATRTPPRAEVPAWQVVQRKLGDTQFLSQVLSCDPACLRAAPALMDFIAAEYFCVSDVAAIASRISTPVAAVTNRHARVSMTDLMRHSGSQPQVFSASRSFRTTFNTGIGDTSAVGEAQEPLSIDRVQRASTTATILLRWCAAMLALANAPAQAPNADRRPSLGRAQATLDKIRAQVVAPLGAMPLVKPMKSLTRALTSRSLNGSSHSPRLPSQRPAKVIPPVSIEDISPRQYCGSAPSSYRKRSALAHERLDPLYGAPSSSSSSKAPGSASTVGLGTAALLIDNATVRVQSLALAKIEQRMARSAGQERLQPLPPVEQSMEDTQEAPDLKKEPEGEGKSPEMKKKQEDDAVLAKAREMMRRRAEEKSSMFENYDGGKIQKKEKEPSSAPAEEVIEPPWKSFHASYMRAEQSTPSAEPIEKVAGAGLNDMERAMKLWEEWLRTQQAKPDVEKVEPETGFVKGGYLESAVCFAADSDQTSDRQEAVLRTVAATVRMRGQLHLQLIACGVELDGPVATMRRLCNVVQFFVSDDIPVEAIHALGTGSSSFIHPSWISPNTQPRYVLCRLHMNDDMELCGHLLGSAHSSNSKLRNQAAWIKSNFEIVTY